MKNLAPIVLFVYKRPWHTRQTVEALQKNFLAEKSILFIFSDGPKNEKDEIKVKEVRKYIKEIKGFKSVEIIEREKNYGLANNIIDGVTRIVNEYGKIIVLEDDIVTSPYFLRFMNEALEKYENEEKVMHISGYMYPINTEGLADTFFIKPTSCWGWATWKRAWNYFEKNPEKLIKEFTRDMIKDFNLGGSYNYWEQAVLNVKGELNTWAIFWYASVYKQKGLSLHPKISYTINIGHDGSGEHCGKSDVFKTTLANSMLQLTDEISLNKEAERRLAEYFNSIKPSLVRRIISSLVRRIVSKILPKSAKEMIKRSIWRNNE